MPRLLRARQRAIQIVRRLSSLPAEAALQVMNAAPAQRVLAARYDSARRVYAPLVPALSPVDAAILHALEDEGVAVTSLSALGLPGSTAMFLQAAALSGVLAGRIKRTGASTISATATELMRHPALFEWGLADRLLRLVEAYIGLPVAYDGLNVFHSAPDGRETGARKWHRDREDWRVLKVGVYVTDVGAADGPFQLMPGDPGSRIEPTPFRYKPFPQRELERRVGAAIAASSVTTVTGPAGTVFISDTAKHFHRGSPPTARSRSVIYYSYFSRPPRHPFFCERSPFSRAELATLAQNLTPGQRECVLWRETVPPAVRLVPRSLT